MSKTEQSLTPPSQVERVGVKIPPFWPEKARLWFAQLEGQFALSNISADTTKFYVTIAYLETQFAAEVEDVILNPPVDNKYNTLKRELIKRLSISDERKLEQLLEKEEIGDRRPSQFLRYLRTLGGININDNIIKILWIKRLPPNIQVVIAAIENRELDEIAEIADKIAEISPDYKIQAISNDKMANDIPSQIAELKKQNAELKLMIDQLSKKIETLTQAGRSRTFVPSFKTAQRPFRNYCYYHAKFGTSARNCIEPCSFKSLNENGSQ
uniref:Putative gypsy52-i ag n=1 Tax=Xenopsylla cheopis TaxID=163159 RepID=A0A6M2DWR4_XENCH